MLLRLMQNTRQQHAKAENDALRDDVAAGRRRLHIKAVCQSVKPPPPPAWIMQPPPDWQTPLNGIISPREADHYAKTTGRDRSILMIKKRESCPYRWATHVIIVSNTHALPAETMPKVIKPSNPFTNVCWVSVLTTFSAPPQILAASTVFFCPIPETKK